VKDFFAQKKAAESAGSHYVPGTQLSYDPKLIAKLKADHAELIDDLEPTKSLNDTTNAAHLLNLRRDYESP
jgi:hypothetical protein